MVNKTRIKNIFFDLVKIDSISGEEEKISRYIFDFFKKLKVLVFFDAYKNVIAKISGKGKAILIDSHMDVVEPGRGVKPVMEENGEIKSSGKTILGADDKAGIASILAMVEEIVKNKIKTRPIELVFTRQEEVGCLGAKNLDYEKLRAKSGLAIDTTAPVNTIVLASANIYSFKIEIIGRSGHSRSPEKAVDAIKVFTEFFDAFKFGRKNKYTTSSVGVVCGGEHSNVICGKLFFSGEIRSLERKIFLAEKIRLFKILNSVCKKYGAKYKVVKETEVFGYKHKKSSPAIQQLACAIKKSGMEPRYDIRMGGTDANVFCARGIEACSIGHGRKNVHSTKESINIKDLAKTAEILLKLV